MLNTSLILVPISPPPKLVTRAQLRGREVGMGFTKFDARYMYQIKFRR